MIKVQKRIVFAHVEEVVAFSKLLEAEMFVMQTKRKGFMVWKDIHKDGDEYVVIIRRPYKTYQTGW